MKYFIAFAVLALTLACSNDKATNNKQSLTKELSKDNARKGNIKQTKKIHNKTVCEKINPKDLKKLFAAKLLRITKSSSKIVKKTFRCTYQCAADGDRFTVYYREVEKSRPGSSLKYYSSKGYPDGKRKIFPKIVDFEIDGKKVAWSQKDQFLAWGKENVRILFFKKNKRKLKLAEVLEFAKNIE